MNRIVLEPSHNTPEVVFDADSQKISIKGISTPENPKAYYKQIFMLMDEYMATTKKTTLDIYLNYYNSGSTKCLLHLFMKITLDPEMKANSTINWIIDEDDEELKESGKIFEEITNLKFNYVAAKN